MSDDWLGTAKETYQAELVGLRAALATGLGSSSQAAVIVAQGAAPTAAAIIAQVEETRTANLIAWYDVVRRSESMTDVPLLVALHHQIGQRLGLDA